jgi:hypothetical protein
MNDEQQTNTNTLEGLSADQIANLVELALSLKGDSQPRNLELPREILDDLETTTAKERKARDNRFVKDLLAYEGGTWTKGGITNKQLVPELRRGTVEAYQLISSKYKDGDKLRYSAQAATEIFDDIQQIFNSDDQSQLERNLQAIQEKCRQLAIYGFSQAKGLDLEARELTTRVIKLPNTLRHLEDPEEDDREQTFTADELDQINAARFQERLFRQSASSPRRGFSNDHQRGSYQRQGGRGAVNNSNYRPNNQNYQQQRSFFGRPRPPAHQQQSNNPYRNPSSSDPASSQQ